MLAFTMPSPAGVKDSRKFHAPSTAGATPGPVSLPMPHVPIPLTAVDRPRSPRFHWGVPTFLAQVSTVVFHLRVTTAPRPRP
jgi:hypothetical protein